MEADCLVSGREDVSVLLSRQNHSNKCQELSASFSSVRKVRGDGNCFYRAFFFAYLESILHNVKALHRFKEKVITTSEHLSSAGFDQSSFQLHLNTVLNVIEHCEGSEREEMLCRLLNDQMTSDNVVQYLRLLTSAHLQNHADDFRNFVEAPSLQVYCHQEVEAMGMECDHVDILALTQALDICIHIVSMDGEDEQLVHHIIPDGAEPSMHLLHHISHFSILGPRPPP
ncbi:ubiquitin thioesterase OTUB2-like isoform X1 [Syngnathoides biaculeatus]|uniref:ubiquitin thioesterase OTUB2-like isoform X1 n=1 Tax=Syngnathoides biaculeatus TaxID=300417 RepID=UPI002ADDE0ED|nr:ubiquitin thioesterase OTUB2-like isoform X1 [Syngnathoides biaculeatus]